MYHCVSFLEELKHTSIYNMHTYIQIYLLIFYVPPYMKTPMSNSVQGHGTQAVWVDHACVCHCGVYGKGQVCMSVCVEVRWDVGMGV